MGILDFNRVPDKALPARLQDEALNATYGPSAAGMQAAIADKVELEATSPTGVISTAIARSTSVELLKFAKPNANKVISNFQSGHGWTLSAASATDDAAEKMVGVQSIKLVTASGTSATASKTGMTAIDGNTKAFRLWIKSADLTKVNRIALIASSDAGFASYYNMTNYFTASEVQRSWKSGEWTCVEFSWESATVTGAPNRAAITALRIVVGPETGQVATVNINQLTTHDDPSGTFPNGVVSLTFDDSWAAHYTVAREELATRGWSGTLYPILERLDTPSYLTTPQVRELAQLYGWEIGGHATTYANHVLSVTGMTSDELVAEFRAIRQWQLDNGFQSYSFAYPNGNFNATTTEEVRQFFSAARLATYAYSQPQSPALPLRLQAVNSGTVATPLATQKAKIDSAYLEGSWAILMFHDITAAAGTGNNISRTDFNDLMAYIEAKGIPVRTVSEVLRANAG